MMPAFLEQDLKAEAAKKGMKGKQMAHYVFGAMNNMGAMRGSKITPKGEAMQRKHEEDMETPEMEARSHSKGFLKRALNASSAARIRSKAKKGMK